VRPPRSTRALSIVTSVAAVAGLAACNSDGRTLKPAKTDQTQSIYVASTTTTAVGAVVDGGVLGNGLAGDAVGVPPTADLAFVLNLPWADGGDIDARFTCNGDDVQPQISWYGAPSGTVEMALVVTDIDAGDFVHWIIAGLDPANPLLGENAVPLGAIEGQNGFSTPSALDVGWRGPCPPAGSPHHYRFSLYALAQQVELPAGSTAADLQAVIDGSAIEVAQVTGLYGTP
jgi:Raf kinase inhibitor-like YbhB/YbcL family protein